MWPTDKRDALAKRFETSPLFRSCCGERGWRYDDPV